jgi:hypothetical protein
MRVGDRREKKVEREAEGGREESCWVILRGRDFSILKHHLQILDIVGLTEAILVLAVMRICVGESQLIERQRFNLLIRFWGGMETLRIGWSLVERLWTIVIALLMVRLKRGWCCCTIPILFIF